MPLSEPPESLRGFPSVGAPQLLYRIHRKGNGPIYFSDSGEARFDLKPPRGTLYCATNERAAFIEVFRTPLVPRAEIEARMLSVLSTSRPHLQLPDVARASSPPRGRREPPVRLVGTPDPGSILLSPSRAERLRLADCTHPEARGFGVTAAINSTPDYPLCQRWAEAFADAGFDGIYYLAGHDPSSSERSVALFQGSRRVAKLSRLWTTDIGDNVIREIEERFGIVVVPTPRTSEGIIGLRVERESIREFL